MVMGKDTEGEFGQPTGGHSDVNPVVENENPLEIDSWHVSGPEG